MTHNERIVLEDWNGKHNTVRAGKPEARNGPVPGDKLERCGKGCDTEKNRAFGEVQGIHKGQRFHRSRSAGAGQESGRGSSKAPQIKQVIDANILFSALINEGITAEILFDERLSLYAPEFLIDEFLKYEQLILEKTKRTRAQFIELLGILRNIIKVVPKEEYLPFFGKADKISPDRNDAPYFALALKLNCGIWSNDKKLKEQDEVEVHSTAELGILLGFNPQ
jgi:predicted nucleic acid-binding protein